MQPSKRILITPGEPAGIGPDIVIQIAQKNYSAQLIVIADPLLLKERAKQWRLPLELSEWDLQSSEAHKPGQLKYLPVSLNDTVIPGKLNLANADYVIQSLRLATSLCQKKLAHALVTGPVHKEIINQSGIPFTGHTEFLANACNVKHTVMLFVADKLKVALATTHLPLADVTQALTKERLRLTLSLLKEALIKHFHLSSPRIYVCGLNPHAGEGGYLGKEEITIITPLLDELRAKGDVLFGPLPADTLFTPSHLTKADAILAMYHDQALPVVKYASFGHAVNVTLGLPFIRTSVDHGTALDIAGTKEADASSLDAAILLAIRI